jgi:type IV pilus assembly protein PilW
MRTSLPEKAPVTTGPLVLFSDLGTTLTFTRTLAAAEQNYRYRIIESTIPLRNSLLLN